MVRIHNGLLFMMGHPLYSPALPSLLYYTIQEFIRLVLYKFIKHLLRIYSPLNPATQCSFRTVCFGMY